MHQSLPHSWDVSPAEAIALQKQLRDQVILQPLPSKIELIGGADISFNRFSDVVYAGIVILQMPDLNIVARAGVKSIANFPYVPGLLSFREAPSLLEAWQKLQVRPDVLVLNGQGIAHPRRLGIAAHIGLLLGIPTIGCAKNVLVGKYQDLDEEAGSTAALVDKNEVVGAALRTKTRVNPVFISPGHLADIETAVPLMLRCVNGYDSGKSRYRIPEPTRQAHLYVNALRRGEEPTS